MVANAQPSDVQLLPQQPAPLQAAVGWLRTLARRRALWLEHLEERRDDKRLPSRIPASVRRALLDADSLVDESDFYRTDSDARVLTERAVELAARIAHGDESPFAQLRDALVLAPADLDVVAVCASAQLEPSFADVFAHLAGDPGQRYVTAALVTRLCGHHPSVCSPSSALAQWKLISRRPVDPGDPTPLEIDPVILAFLDGREELDAALLNCAWLIEPRPPLPRWPVGEIATRIRDALGCGVPSRIVVVGPPLSGRRTFAACVSAELGIRVLSIDTDAIPESRWGDLRLRAQRHGLLYGCALAWHGSRAERALEAGSVRLPVEFVVAEPPADFRGGRGWLEERVELPGLLSSERAELWADALQSVECSEAEHAHIANRFVVQVGEIQQLIDQCPRNYVDVERFAREITRGRLGELGMMLPCPFSRHDLKLPERVSRHLDELLFEARDRVHFWENARARRLFPRGTGLVALLSGPPGTGKTMAAQVIAAELGLDLFRIDLASTVSKYIGETAKNLRKVFARAAAMNAILLFDEADALFSRRTEVRDAHDRHANADTNYLLQLVEDYPGVALLATNKRQNMDEAFVRRVRYVFHFPRPAIDERRAIWEQLVGELGAQPISEPLGDALAHLAASVETTGAQIKNAVLAAAFFARERGVAIEADDIWRGLERELSNQGRQLPARPQPRGSRGRS